MALHLSTELDNRARETTFEQWKPEPIFKVRTRQPRLPKDEAGHSEAGKNRPLSEMEPLLAGLIVLDPARAAALRA